MTPSTRTPEGTPNICPVCGNEVCIEPSQPLSDAPCPFCGSLLLFESHPAKYSLPLARLAADWMSIQSLESQREEKPDTFDIRAWLICGFVCSIIIWSLDGLLSAAIWSVTYMVIGFLILPTLIAKAERTAKHCGFYLAVILGWGLIPGPLVGSLFGSLSPIIFHAPVTSLGGALLGLMIGPAAAAVEGVVVVGMVSLGFRVVTGKYLTNR